MGLSRILALPRARSYGPARAADSGFTLIEAVVALFVLGTIFTALAYAATGSLRASMSSRAEQQAIDFATEALEAARQADYYTLANLATVGTGDSRVVSCGSAKCIDPGTGTLEPLITSSTGTARTGVPVNSNLGNHVAFTVSTYVTDPDDDAGDFKRITVVSDWQIGGNLRFRTMSSLVTVTDRGLPIPVFKLTPVGGTARAVNRGTDAEFLLELTNQGAPDRWNLTVSPTATWLFYADNGDGLLCLDPADPQLAGITLRACPEGSSYDVQLTDTTSDGIVDTGRIDPTATKAFWAMRPVAGDAALGDYWTQLTATSKAVADATSALDLLVQVVGGSVTTDPEPPPVLTAVPGPPQSLILDPDDRGIVATWSAPLSAGSSPITDYVIRYKPSSQANWILFNDGTSTATTATISGLTNGTTYDVQVTARNATGEGVVGANGSCTPSMSNVYVAPTRCAKTVPAATASSGYTLKEYALHNRAPANPSWPGTGVPPASSTVVQGIPLTMAVDGPQFPVGTILPVYSNNIVWDRRGRVITDGGSFTTNDTTKVVDWRTGTGGKQYNGTAVARFWLAPVLGDDISGLGYSIQVQLYRQKSTETTPQSNKMNGVHQGAPVAVDTTAFACGNGWQEVAVSLPVSLSNALAANEYLGLRIWNVAGTNRAPRIRLGYDVAGDYPASLTLPEK